MSAVLVGFVSAKGSPGVTTTALAMATEWPRPAVVVEADPFGGDIRAGLGCGEWPPAAGLTEALVDLRTTGIDEALSRRVHQVAAHTPPVLAGLGCVGQATALPWARIGASLAGLAGADVLADCGRFAAADGVPDLLRACDAVVLLTGSTLRSVRAASRVVSLLQQSLGTRSADPWVSVLVVNAGAPYSAEEIARVCRLPLLGELPDDPRSAGVWSDGDRPQRGFWRSPLQREARRIAAALADRVSVSRGVA